jgi:hypothetical protein
LSRKTGICRTSSLLICRGWLPSFVAPIPCRCGPLPRDYHRRGRLG